MPSSLPPRAAEALARDKVIDIITTGARTGQPRRTEIWFHRVEDRIYITGSPGKRDWYANLLADPSFTFHLKESHKVDLPAHAIPITDPAERRSVTAQIVGPDYDRDKFEARIKGSPLIEVVFD
ncbi:MAG: nitroreductase/quinone reductase family protein [Anaerolineales bacterium]|jgi:deazaflavin-dependent oxidoreductase (nitroreductase family)